MSRLGSGKGLLVLGIIVAVGFGTLLVVSNQLATDATNWYDHEDVLLVNSYNAGNFGSDELAERRFQNDMIRDWMEAQVYSVRPVAMAGIYIGLLLLVLGFVTLATGGSVDEQTKRMLLTIGGVLLVVMFILFTGTLNISIT